MTGSTAKEGAAKPVFVVLAAYESKTTSGVWKAFAAPYGITTQASTCEEAKKKIEELVALYEDGLKKHGYPDHLTFVKFTDGEDKKVFANLWKKIVKEIKAETEKARDFNQLARRGVAGHIRMNNTVASFYQPRALAFA